MDILPLCYGIVAAEIRESVAALFVLIIPGRLKSKGNTMKCFAFSLVLCLIATSVMAQEITVHIRGIRSEKGTVRFALYNSRASYKNLDESQAFARLELRPWGKSVKVTLGDVPKGKYALSVHHDENGNGKMDYLLMIPREGYGFPDHYTGIGKPDFEQIALTVTDADLSITSSMKY